MFSLQTPLSILVALTQENSAQYERALKLWTILLHIISLKRSFISLSLASRYRHSYLAIHSHTFRLRSIGESAKGESNIVVVQRHV